MTRTSTVVYTPEHRLTWGDGPWQNEPDLVVFLDDLTEYPCVLSRTVAGHWCGYVAIPPEHPWFKRDDIDQNLRCHGGITYDSSEPPPAIDAEHMAYRWVGFDCGHPHDLIPGGLASLVRGVASYEVIAAVQEAFAKLDQLLGKREYRTLKYVDEQIESICLQLYQAATQAKARNN